MGIILTRFVSPASDYDDLYRLCVGAEKSKDIDPKSSCGKIRLAVE